jgi:uncharacterized membrane protein YqjE
MKSFVAKLTALTLLVALVGWLVYSMLLPEYYIPALPFLLAFFYVVTLVLHIYQLKMSKKDLGKFTRSNMIVTFIKLMLYSVVAVVYIAIDKENAIPFAACLMVLYLVFTIFEIKELTKISQSKISDK